MKTSFHRIKTDDDFELCGLLFEPDKKSKIAVAHVHGMAGNFFENKFLDYLAEIFTKNNIAFAPFNNRGYSFISDSRVGENDYKRFGSAYEKFEDCLDDIRAQIDFLEKQGYSQIFLCGHSLGTPKVAYYQSKTQDKRVKSVIFLSPTDMIGLVKEDKTFNRDIKEANDLIKSKKEKQLLTNEVWGEYPISAKTYISLFGNKSNTAIFNFFEPSKGFKSLSKIKSSILAIMGKKDDVVIVPIEKIMKIIENNTKSAICVKTIILGDATHDYKNYEKKLANEIVKWIKSLMQKNEK
ncbi:alpha/beta hydrolase [Patescibacteria group bacterium]